MAHDLASRSVGIGIELELTEKFANDLLMLLGLLQVLFPFFLEFLVDRATYRRLIDLHPAHFRF
jgi:hypothetical protein